LGRDDAGLSQYPGYNAAIMRLYWCRIETPALFTRSTQSTACLLPVHPKMRQLDPVTAFQMHVAEIVEKV
jgi:hypothetical protein